MFETSQLAVNCRWSQLLSALLRFCRLLTLCRFLLASSPRNKALNITLLDPIKRFASKVTQQRFTRDLITAMGVRMGRILLFGPLEKLFHRLGEARDLLRLFD